MAKEQPINAIIWPLLLGGMLVAMLAGCGPLWEQPATPSSDPFIKYFGGESPDSAVTVAATDSRYYMLGTSYSRGADSADAVLIMTDLSGNELNRRYWGGTGVDHAAFLLELGTDNWVIGINRNDTTPLIIQVDGDLNEISQLEISDRRGNWTLTQAISLQNGGILLGGHTTQVDTSKNQQSEAPASRDPLDMWFVGLDASLNVQWERIYGFTGADDVVSLARSGSTVAVLASTHFPATEVDADAMLLYLNEEGFILDQYIIDENAAFLGGALTEALDGTWLLARNLDPAGLQQNSTRFSSLSADLRTLQSFQADSLIIQVGSMIARPDGDFMVWGATQGRRKLKLMTMNAQGTVVPGSVLYFGSDEYRHQTGGMLMLNDGNMLLGCTFGWGQDNSIISLVRTSSTGLNP